MEIKDNSISQKEIILKDKIGRIRDIEVNSKGEIFIITDEKIHIFGNSAHQNKLQKIIYFSFPLFSWAFDLFL